MAMKTPIHSSKTSDRQNDHKYQQNQTAPSKTAEPFSRRWRFNPSFHESCVRSSRPIYGSPVHDSTIQLDSAIFSCAPINLSYKARKPSESTRVPPMSGMKFVSPVQRGTTWMCM